MAGGSPETVFCILKHLEGMLPRCPGVFDDEYRQFFTRYRPSQTNFNEKAEASR